MTAQFFGQIDLTKIAAIVQQQPELVRKATFQDGEHMLLAVNINDMQRTDAYGNTHTITAYCRKDDRQQNLNYFIGNLKPNATEPQAAADTNQNNTFWDKLGRK